MCMDGERRVTFSMVAAGNFEVESNRCTADKETSPDAVGSSWSNSDRYSGGGSPDKS